MLVTDAMIVIDTLSVLITGTIKIALMACATNNIICDMRYVAAQKHRGIPSKNVVITDVLHT